MDKAILKAELNAREWLVAFYAAARKETMVQSYISRDAGNAIRMAITLLSKVKAAGSKFWLFPYELDMLNNLNTSKCWGYLTSAKGINHWTSVNEARIATLRCKLRKA